MKKRFDSFEEKEMKSSLGSIYYSFICFFIQIFCNINNLKEIRFFDSLKEIHLSKSLVLILLIIVSLTLIFSTISNLLNILMKSIEDCSIDNCERINLYEMFPYSTFVDLFVSLLILLPKLLIDTQLIVFNLREQSLFIFICDNERDL